MEIVLEKHIDNTYEVSCRFDENEINSRERNQFERKATSLFTEKGLAYTQVIDHASIISIFFKNLSGDLENLREMTKQLSEYYNCNFIDLTKKVSN